MLNSPNPKTPHRGRAACPIADAENCILSEHGFSLAETAQVLAQVPFARCIRSMYSALPDRDRSLKLLDSSLSHTKHTTSQFLIENSCTFSSPLTLLTSNLEFLNSSSNRPSPRLEILVSHRKQTVGPISNRPKFALCNFRCLSFSASVTPCHFASSPVLIANDMHSHAESSACKQSTYRILIANEFHYLRSTNNYVRRGSSAASSPGLGIQASLAQQTGLCPPAIRYNEKQATSEPIASPGRKHGISYRAAA